MTTGEIIILSVLGIITFKLFNMANELDNLRQEVEENTSVQQSAITLLNTLKTKLDKAIASGDMTQVQALSDQLSGNTDALAAAVAANTPADPNA